MSDFASATAALDGPPGFSRAEIPTLLETLGTLERKDFAIHRRYSGINSVLLRSSKQGRVSLRIEATARSRHQFAALRAFLDSC